VRYKRYYKDPECGQIKVYFLGDIHEGAANSRTDLLIKAVEIIKSEPNSYWVGMGDLIDAINYHDKRFNVREVSDKYKVSDLDNLPKVQADYLLDILKPIADGCLGILDGNHEDKIRQRDGFDVISYICGVLNAPCLGKKAYLSIGANVRGSRNRPFFMIDLCVAHGSGGSGGKTPGGSINKCVDIFQYDVADVYVIGHCHGMACKSALRNEIRGNGVVKTKVYYGVTGTFLMKSSMDSDAYFEDGVGIETAPGFLKMSFDAYASSKKDANVTMMPVELM